MSVVITGGTGFVGLALTEALQEIGRDSVLFGYAPMPGRFADRLARASFVAGDVTSSADVDLLLNQASANVVVHLAAVTPDREAEMRDPASAVAVNIGGTANLLRAVSRLNPRPRVFIASSVAVYGEVPPPAGTYREEEAVPAPASLYGITKLAAETTALRLAQLYEIELTIVRLGPVYGPWEYKTGLRPLLSPHAQVIDLWQRGEDVVLPRCLRGDWLYSRDAGRGLASLVSAERLHHQIYNLGGETITSLADWCEELRPAPWSRGWKVAGPEEHANVVFGLSQDRAPLDIERIKTDVGFLPRFTGRAAANDYISWLATVGE